MIGRKMQLEMVKGIILILLRRIINQRLRNCQKLSNLGWEQGEMNVCSSHEQFSNTKRKKCWVGLNLKNF